MSSPPSIMAYHVSLCMPGALLVFTSFGGFLTSDVMISGTPGESGLVFFCESCPPWSAELNSSV